MKRILLSMVFLLVACVGMQGQWGHFVIDDAVTKEFTAGIVRKDCQFYYAGREYPRAIIAINKSYALAGDLWVSRDFEPLYLRDVVGNMEAKDGYSGLKGFRLVGRDGEEIGVWFSQMKLVTMVERVGANGVKVYPPEPEREPIGHEGVLSH
ncbi:MAG: hypothetical protein K9K75_02675 [Deltaproteobacteria bacterium]|nr:hypothetical protein [Deltaproteobacteria bacterium]